MLSVKSFILLTILVILALLLVGCERSPEEIARDVEEVERTLPEGCSFHETEYNYKTVYLVYCDGLKTISTNMHWSTRSGKTTKHHHETVVVFQK